MLKIFPPPELPGMRLQVFPLPDDNPSREAFKVIASFKPLDFSFLKVPDGRIFAGAAATELKKVLSVLRKAPRLQRSNPSPTWSVTAAARSLSGNAISVPGPVSGFAK